MLDQHNRPNSSAWPHILGGVAGRRNLLAAATMAIAAVLGFSAACRGGGGDDLAVRDDAVFLFDDAVIRTYELVIDEADWEWLNDNELLEQYVPATLLFEGEEYPQVAVRYKGFFDGLISCFITGTRTCKKLSVKLKFSEYDENGRFHGLKRLNFQSMERDPTRMHEVLAYRLYREAGVPAPRAAYAKLVVNGEPLGLFTLVEQIDGQFARSRFPDGGWGNLYKEVWPIHSDPEPYLEALRTNREEDPSVDKMIRFARALDVATAETFLSVLGSWTDVDMLVSYLAVDRLTDNWDGPLRWLCFGGRCTNHNYYWYEDTEQDRVWLIPWDLNHTFEVPSRFRSSADFPDWDMPPASCEPVEVSAPDEQAGAIPDVPGLGDRPAACDEFTEHLSTAAWDLYAERTRELLDGPFQVTTLHDRIDGLAERIAGAVAEDPNGPTSAEWQAAVRQLKDNVVTMRAYIAAKVDP